MNKTAATLSVRDQVHAEYVGPKNALLALDIFDDTAEPNTAYFKGVSLRDCRGTYGLKVADYGKLQDALSAGRCYAEARLVAYLSDGDTYLDMRSVATGWRTIYLAHL